MKTPPCKDCICFAVCNAKVHRLAGVYKTHFVFRELGNCSLLNAWADNCNEDNNFPYPPLYCGCKEQLKVLCKFFNVKYDITPDYNLLRHLNHFQTMTTHEDHFQRI